MGIHLDRGFGLGCGKWVPDAGVLGVGDIVQWGRVGLDWPQVFPSSMVPLALGLYIVTVQHGRLSNDGPSDVPTIYWGPEEHFLDQGGLWESMSSMGLIELHALCLFV